MKLYQQVCSLLCNFSLFINLFLPYLAIRPAYADEPTPTTVSEPTSTPEVTAIPEITTAPEPTIVAEEPTVAPTLVPTLAEEPTVTPVVTEEPTITPEATVTPEITAVPSENNNNSNNDNNNNQPSDNNSSNSNSSPASPTPTFMLPSPTPSPRVVDQVCLSNEDVIRDSVELDWNYDCTTDTYVTREKVKLGVKYIFPKENNVTVTFTSLPKDELYRSYLKIKQVKTSDLKLPGDIGNVGEYAYDITTDMFDGEFKYDITLPKNSNQTAEISYIEKSLDQAKTSVLANEINSIDETRVEQSDNSIKATSVDHFTIFIVYMFDSNGQVVVNPSEPDSNHKIDICHANSGVKSYVTETVDDDSILKTSGHNSHADDIIPKFDYQVSEVVGTQLVCPSGYSPSIAICPGRCYKNNKPLDSSKCVDKVSEPIYGLVTHSYPGKNWTPENQAILNNGCKALPTDATLIVKKHVISDNGGTKFAGDFTLKIGNTSFTGTEGGTTFTIPAGSYSVSETQLAGYEKTSDDCTGTISGGQTKTCTIVNDDIAPKLKLTKIVDNKGSGTAVPANWTLSAVGSSGFSDSGNSTTFHSVKAGVTYSLSESTGPTGYSASWWTCNGGQASGNTVLLALGDTVTCSITNTRDLGTLKVHKFNDVNVNKTNDVGEDGLPGWEMKLYSGTTCSGSSLQTLVTNSYGNVDFGSLATGDYSVKETLKTGWKNSTDLCQKVTIANNADSTLNFGNYQLGSIKIAKQTNPDRSLTAFRYTGSLGTHYFYDGDVDTYSNLEKGTYTITEDGNSDWKLTGLVCTGGSSVVTQLNNRQVTIDLKVGENVTCTFTNTKLGSIYGHKFNDKNGDNDIDFGENMLNGWQIFIDTNRNGTLDPTETVDTTNGSFFGEDLGHFEFNNLLPDTYRVCEVSRPGWFSSLANNSNCQDISIGAGQDKEVFVGNHQQVTIRAYKVVCDNESKLPNWGNDAPSINSSTAQNYVNSHPGCSLESGWDFQYGFNGQVSKYGNGDQLGLAPTGSGWNLLGTTNNSGYAEATIPQVTGNGIWVRESLKAGYVPFSYPPAGPTADNKSAELYCHTDGEHYDNYDQVDSPSYGNTYYCVAFNALKFGHLTVQKTSYPSDDDTLFSVTVTGNGTINGSNSGRVSDSTDKTFDMTPGIYSVSETVPEGWEQISNNCNQISVVAGQTATCEIVNRKLGKIVVTKYNDLNGNGIQDDGENSMSGWTMNLSQQSKVTNSDGIAEFENLTPDTYYLSEDQQKGWTQTSISCSSDGQDEPTPTATPTETPTECTRDADRDEVCDNVDNCPNIANSNQADDDSDGIGNACDTCNDPRGGNCTCGDGVVNTGEQCDDGNRVNNDACSNTCQNVLTLNPKKIFSVKTVNAQGMPGHQISVKAGDNITCKVGNRLITPTALISKTNDALGNLVPGSSVGYKIKLTISGNDVNNFKVTDLLSNGFKYRVGSYNVLINGVNQTVGITEPQYHSPGVWYLGNLKVGDTVELSYIADISTDQQPGTYADLAWAMGDAAYESSTVYAAGENSQYINENFVGTQVPVVKSTQNSVSAGVERQETITGDVLGASTELPSTGASTNWLIISALMSLLGFILLNKKSTKKLLTILFFAAFFLFPNNAQAMSNLSLRVEQPKTPTNKDNFDIVFVALDITGGNVAITCAKKGPSDAAYVDFGAVQNFTNGGNSGTCHVDSNILNAKGDYSFRVTAVGSETKFQEVTVGYKNEAPGTPGDYRKEHPNNCDYKIHFKTADDGGKTVKVELYRADVTSFILDAGSVVASVSVGSNEERDITNSVPDCSKNYYYVLRAFDDAGNGSGTVGDSVVTTTTTTSTTVGTTTTNGAIPVTGINQPTTGAENAGESGATTNEGQVLGTQNVAQTFLKKYWFFLIIALVVIVSIIGYVLPKKKKSRR